MCNDVYNSQIEFEKNTWCGEVFILMCRESGRNQILKIGERTHIGGGNIFLSNNSKCIIGKDCVMSYNLDIRTSDGHTIFDKSGNIINRQKNALTIGDKCWIALAVRITKNAVIPNNTIVGEAAMVTKVFTEENTIIAGNPAQVIKTGVYWDEKDICEIEYKY